MYSHPTNPLLTLSHFPIAPFFHFSPPQTHRSQTLNFSAPQILFPVKIRAFGGFLMADLDDSNAFYLVRKGEMIGIYKTLADCQAQAGSSVYDPSISVYKGYGMSKEAEEFLRSHGLKNASYSVTVNDAKDNLFGKFGALTPCPYQQPASFGAEGDNGESSPKRWQEAVELLELAERTGFSSLRSTPQKKIVKPQSSTTFVGNLAVSSSRESAVNNSFPTITQNKFVKSHSFMTPMGTPTFSSSSDTCVIEFDGASKGNPGLAGAGVVLRAADGSSIREGVGLATNNVAEYRALLLGLKQALKRGFKHIRAQGDSKLVVMQVQGKWKTKNPNMANLCTEVKALREKFVSFQIEHVLREYNSEADAQANRAVNLRNGQLEEDCQKM